MAANLKDIFNEVEEVLNENQLKRDSIREASKILENQVIQVVQIIRRVHQGEDNASVISEAKAKLAEIPNLYKTVADLVPPGCYFKFHDIWRPQTTKVFDQSS